MSAPAPVGGFQIYNSYVTDPYYTRILAASWAALVGAVCLYQSPRLVRSIRRDGFLAGWMLYEADARGFYLPLGSPDASDKDKKGGAPIVTPTPSDKSYSTLQALVCKASLFLQQPRARHLSIAHLSALALIPILILATLLPEQHLYKNANRLGFFTVSLFVPVFLFAGKKAPLPFLSSSSYISWNVLHRWLGRALFVLGLAHGSLWLHQYNQSGQLDAQLGTAKVQRGIATLAFLFLLNISSLSCVRQHVYWLFFSLHVVGYVGALVLVVMHTPYALPWILYGVVIVYAIDLGTRICLCSTFTTATLTPLEDGLTQVWVHHTNTGWQTGQHVQLRVFFSPNTSSLRRLLRPFEAHPFTIAAAPPNSSALPDPIGFPLYVRSQGPGSWSGDLHAVPSGSTCFVHVEGPYGSPVSLHETDTLVLAAGGSGATWTLAMLDDAIGRCMRSQEGRLKKCFWVWSIRHASHAGWFAQRIHELSAKARDVGLDLDTRIFISRPRPTDTLPETGCQVTYATPDAPHLDFAEVLREVIQDATNPCTSCSNCTCAHRPENGRCCPRDAEGCCQSKGSSNSSEEKTSCCSSSKSSSQQPSEMNKSCCSSSNKALPPNAVTWSDEEKTAVQLDPVLIRSGGLTLAVCGPKSMQADARAAASQLHLRQIQKVGGVHVVTESFGV